MEEELQAELKRLSEDELWRRYVAQREPDVRKLLIRCNLELARKIAASLYAQRITNEVDFQDYLQYARVGLVESIDRFDPSREASFPTYASYRIRGAILNGIEHATEHTAQREHRRRVRAEERLISARERAGSGVSGDTFDEMVDVTIALALGYILEDSGMWRTLDDDAESDPYKSYEFKRLKERMALIVQALPEREQAIMKYHYFEHMEFTDIGELLGLSKGRISQLHSRALRLVREAYGKLSKFNISI
ncbi:MAG TPA: sigma-70 family RNA polymerase sigma factor [Burkholderiales bacterium]|nr:sigma-70 family RNA polymerase sigma factor [Burkholderiales bacterium]